MKKLISIFVFFSIPLFFFSCRQDKILLDEDDFFVAIEETGASIDKRPLNEGKVLEIPVYVAAEAGEEVTVTVGIDDENTDAVEGVDFEFVNGKTLTYPNGAGYDTLIIKPFYGGTPGDLNLNLFLEDNTAGYNMGFFYGENQDSTSHANMLVTFIAGSLIEFNVTDSYDEPLESATIQLGPFANETGNYEFEDIPEGDDYEYTVELDGFATEESTINVTEDKEINIALKTWYDIAFNVIDENGAAIDDAVIKLGNNTNSAGEYEFEDILFGSYECTVTRDGFVKYVETIDVNKNVTDPIEIELLFAHDLTFDVTDNFGDIVDDAIISIETVDGETITNEEGDYLFVVPEGDYDYTVTREGFADYEGTINVSADITVPVELTTLYQVTFILIDEDAPHESVSGAVIELENQTTFESIVNDADDYEFMVPADDYNYEITHEDYETATGTISVSSDMPVPVVISMVPKGN